MRTKANFLLAVVLLALLGANIRFLFHQVRIERKLEMLQAENQRLAEQLAERPSISAEELRTARAQLDKAASYIDAVENRLTNATALLSSVQQAATSKNSQITRLPGGVIGHAEPAPTPSAIQDGNLPRGGPSMSHTPDGQLLHRSWGVEQVVGPPNTTAAGDIPTAWAQRSSTGAGEEWLHVNYDRAVDISEINVRETHNPGAISRITALLPTGQEILLWQGTEPSAQAPVDMKFTVPPGVQAQSVKVYLDRQRVPGWNEIDAVELVGRDGSRQWASSASASSSYADP